MPNICEFPDLSLMIQFVPIRSMRFHLMFKRDEHGKCRLRMNDDEWHFLNDARRDDWNVRLKNILKASGSYGDWLVARRLFGIDL